MSQRISPFAEAWLEELSPSAIQQLAIVKDLLRHANEDSMSAGDRLICAEALKVLPERAKAEQNRLRERQKIKEGVVRDCEAPLSWSTKITSCGCRDEETP